MTHTKIRPIAGGADVVSGPLDSGLYTLVEAAQRLGVGDAFAYQLAQAGEFPVPIVRLGRVKRVRVAELEAWLQGSTKRL
jgi:excisionase family DNA binding protein